MSLGTHSEQPKQDPLPRADSAQAQSSRLRIVVTVAIFLALASFVLNFSIAQRLAGVGAVDQYDVLFNADTIARLECMVSHDCSGRSSFAHPNLAVFLNPPVQLAALILNRSLLGESNEAQIRRGIALVLCPLVSAMKAPIVFFFFLLLGVSIRAAGLLGLLSVVTFSQLIFGSIPESFALSGLLIAAAYLLAVREMRTGSSRIWPWMLIGFVTMGITVTNLAFVVILFVTTRLYIRTPIKTVAIAATFLIAGSILPTVALTTIYRYRYSLREVDVEGGINYTMRWLRIRGYGERVVDTPIIWAHTLAAPMPGTVGNRRATQELSKFKFAFTLSPKIIGAFKSPVTLAILLLLLAGAAVQVWGKRLTRFTFIASVLIIGFSWCLHSVWGAEIFLYSQHWQLSLLVVLAGPFHVMNARVRSLAGFALCALILAVAIQNAITIRAILLSLEGVA